MVHTLPWTGELPEETEAEDVDVDDVDKVDEDEEEELCPDSPPGSFESLSESSIATEHVSTSCTLTPKDRRTTIAIGDNLSVATTEPFLHPFLVFTGRPTLYSFAGQDKL
jgi:hypothetical protein